MKPSVVITHWVHPEVIELLEKICEVIPNTSRDTLPREEIINRSRDAEAIIAFGADRIDDEFLLACPKLKIVSSTLKHVKHSDIEACTKRGVWFTVVQDLRTVPAAELTVGLLIGIARRMTEGDRYIRSGKFSGWRPDLYGTGLANHTIGIVGMGAVGQEVAKRLIGFDMKIFYCDPNPLPRDREYSYHCTRLSFEELLASSDYVVLSVPPNPENRAMINSQTLSLMKKGSYLVNTSNGAVVDESAVAEALDSGQLSGYAADVFEMENSTDHSMDRSIPKTLLDKSESTFFTPHIGSAVDETRVAIEMEAAHNILQVLNSEYPKGAVNYPVTGTAIGSEQFF